MPKSKSVADNKVETPVQTMPPSPVQEVNFNDVAFQNALDKQISPGVLDVENITEPPVTPDTPDNKEDVTLSPEEIDYIKNQYGLVDSKRYEDSSQEGKRLAQKVKEWEPYAALLDGIARDKALQRKIYDHFEKGGEASPSVKDDLKLPEDYVFDADEAMKNPNSIHRQVFTAQTIKIAEQIADKKLAEIRKEESQKREQDRLATDARLFKEKMNMPDDEFEKMIEWSKGNPITLEGLHYLYTRKDRDKKIATSAIKDKISQATKTGQIPRTMGSKGESTIERSEDDVVFDSLLKARKGVVTF